MKYLGPGCITDPPRVVKGKEHGDTALDLLCGLEHVTAPSLEFGFPSLESLILVAHSLPLEA